MRTYDVSRHTPVGDLPGLSKYHLEPPPSTGSRVNRPGDPRHPWFGLRDSKSMEFVVDINNGERTIPVVAISDRSIIVEPTNAALASKLGIARDRGAMGQVQLAARNWFGISTA